MPAAARDTGAVVKVERLSLKDLEPQVTENGVTWLDHGIAARVRVWMAEHGWVQRASNGNWPRHSKTARST